MPTSTSFTRQLLIISKLEVKPYSSFDDLYVHVVHQLELQQLLDEKLKTDFGKRTFNRDVQDIYNSFGIEIAYAPKHKGYFISNRTIEKAGFQRLKESYELQNALNLSQSLSTFVHLEKRRPLGTEHLFQCITAIKKKLHITFDHEKYLDGEITHRLVAPYGLKESKHRWYLIAKDSKDDTIKNFGLDRISNIEMGERTFKPAKDFNVESYFRYCFGIIRPNNQEPQLIILSFEALQGKYIKSFPLHEKQQILVDTPEELRVQLELYITEDLIMELASHCGTMKVIAPQCLKDAVKKAFGAALKQY